MLFEEFEIETMEAQQIEKYENEMTDYEIEHARKTVPGYY